MVALGTVEPAPLRASATMTMTRWRLSAVALSLLCDRMPGEGGHAGAPRPDFMLLDLNLPGRDGRQVLAEIKADPELRRIPVVVLTGSKAEEDVVRSYDFHANAYVTKPVDFQSFVHVIRKIDEFFISVVRLPPS